MTHFSFFSFLHFFIHTDIYRYIQIHTDIYTPLCKENHNSIFNTKIEFKKIISVMLIIKTGPYFLPLHKMRI